jgi:hypothetical protein
MNSCYVVLGLDSSLRKTERLIAENSVPLVGNTKGLIPRLDSCNPVHGGNSVVNYYFIVQNFLRPIGNLLLPINFLVWNGDNDELIKNMYINPYIHILTKT